MKAQSIVGESLSVLNREGTFVPTGEWVQVLRIGEFVGKSLDGNKFSQVIDEAALDTIVNAFVEDAKAPNFPGLLIDRDHLSHYSDRETKAAGWVTHVEKRPDGLWVMPKWTPSGAEEVANGTYRLVSPVLTSGTDLGQTKDGTTRVRPGKFIRLAITNDPNIKGMVPLTHRHHAKTGEQSMDYKLLLLNRLGLTDVASDKDIEDAINTSKAKPSSGVDETMFNRLRSDLTEMTNRNSELEKVVIESEVVKYRGIGMKDEEVREALVANRATSVKIFESIIANKKVGKDGEDGKRTHDTSRRAQPSPMNGTEQERAERIERLISDERLLNRDASYDDVRNIVRYRNPELFQPVETN